MSRNDIDILSMVLKYMPVRMTENYFSESPIEYIDLFRNKDCYLIVTVSLHCETPTESFEFNRCNEKLNVLSFCLDTVAINPESVKKDLTSGKDLSKDDILLKGSKNLIPRIIIGDNTAKAFIIERPFTDSEYIEFKKSYLTKAIYTYIISYMQSIAIKHSNFKFTSDRCSPIKYLLFNSKHRAYAAIEKNQVKLTPSI